MLATSGFRAKLSDRGIAVFGNLNVGDGHSDVCSGWTLDNSQLRTGCHGVRGDHGGQSQRVSRDLF